MIKVAHILHTFLPVTENWIYNQLIYNENCKQVLISQFCKNVSQFPVETLYSACSDHYKAKICNYFSRMKFWPPQSYYDSIITYEKPDLIHGHFSTESWRVLKIVQKKRIPLVTTFYGLDVNKLPKRQYWKKRYPILFRTGRIFIVEGNYMAQRLVELGCDIQKIRTVHIGVDIERIREKLVGFNPDNNVFKVLFIGLSREKKGSLDAAEAFCRLVKEHENSELHLIGDGKFKKIVERKMIENRCLSKAFFHGFVNVDKYYRLLAQCDVVLTPSHTAKDGDTEGGAPVVCIESQAAGKTVVGTLHCDIPEIVIHGKTGLLSNEHDINNLTVNLLTLARDPQLRKKLGDQGFEHVKKNHDIKKQVAQIVSIYRSITVDRRI